MPRPLLLKALTVMFVALSTFVIARADLPNKRSTESLARCAVGADTGDSAKAVADLRAMGPEGLRVFLETNRPEIEAAVRTSADFRAGDSPNQVLQALDSICKQKDCYASRLYWYTDLDQARSAASAEGKPVLSLRLLGQLDEDLSCANSRLFRITLYANEQVSKLLRERFVLHWQSERPVPKVTIDFGDGRKMQRTLTGNSIHYALDSEGRVIDVLPGLYGPVAFLRELERISSAATRLQALKTDEERRAELRRYHETRLNELENSWLTDVKRAGLRVAPSREIPAPGGPGSPPSAERAAPIAVAKAVSIERPILRGMSENPKPLDTIASDAGWSIIARIHYQDTALDKSTLSLMSFKDPSLVGGQLQYATIILRGAMAEDTVRNEYVFRTRILEWLAKGAAGTDLAGLNEKVYAELFLTPSWDAWLGLRPGGAYSGIDNDGVRK